MDFRIIKILNFIENNVYESISLNELANLANLSLFHFHRLFKKETQVTAKQFIDSMKMEKALDILVNTNMSIADLAISLGFNDYETFSRNFKKYHKISPVDLRNILKNFTNKSNQKVIVINHESYNEDEITQKLIEKIREANYNPLQDEQVTTLIVFKNKQTADTIKPTHERKLRTRSKFNVVQSNKIWERVMRKIQSEKL